MSKKNVFTPGPLYEKRKQLLSNLEKLNLKTGDIVFNSSNVKGPFGIPFAKWVQKYTNSKYSHATIMYVDNNEYYAIDVSDYGTRKLRVLDWFDNWDGVDFCVYRLKNHTIFDELNFKDAIIRFLNEDPSYDFNFNDPNKYYCTESVERIYSDCGYDLGGSYLLKDIVPWWFCQVILRFDILFKWFSDSSLPSDTPIIIVGNEEKGMRASPLIEKIYEYDGATDTSNYVQS
jgi:Permuted papain-like amidase enzyme, YaeF/YiiX, C92 family